MKNEVGCERLHSRKKRKKKKRYPLIDVRQQHPLFVTHPSKH